MQFKEALDSEGRREGRHTSIRDLGWLKTCRALEEVLSFSMLTRTGTHTILTECVMTGKNLRILVEIQAHGTGELFLQLLQRICCLLSHC